MPNQDSHGDPEIELWAALLAIITTAAFVALFAYLTF